MQRSLLSTNEQLRQKKGKIDQAVNRIAEKIKGIEFKTDSIQINFSGL
jgi:hypothetical protein